MYNLLLLLLPRMKKDGLKLEIGSTRNKAPRAPLDWRRITLLTRTILKPLQQSLLWEKPSKINKTPTKVNSQLGVAGLPNSPPKTPPKPSVSPLKQDSVNKRKAESPLVNDAKKAGSGDRVTHHAERYKSVFFTDKNFLKLRDLSQRKELSTVEREKSKVEIGELENKYRRFILENPNGRDPEEDRHWKVVKAELDKIRTALRFL